MHSTFNYVRTCRLKGGLSVQELAALIGQQSSTAISQFEHGDRLPTFKDVLALQIVFGLQPREMFPELFEYVADAVMRHAAALDQQVGDGDGRFADAKRALLESLPGRAKPTDIQL